MEAREKQLLLDLRDARTSHRAFASLVERYQKQVYAIIRKMLIDHDDTNDAVQETFIKVWKSLKKFDEKSDLFTWIYRIATNEALQVLRKRRTQKTTGTDSYEMLAGSLVANQQLNGDEVQMKLQLAILKLPDKQRLIFNLKYYEDLKYEQIAEITDTSVGALKAGYHHAVKKIGIILGMD